MKEYLSSPGSVPQWIEASQIAMKSGDFSRIKYHKRDQIITAKYGSDTISVLIEPKDSVHVNLIIEASDKQVLDWFKHCVADVMLHPERYEDGAHKTTRREALAAERANRKKEREKREALAEQNDVEEVETDDIYPDEETELLETGGFWVRFKIIKERMEQKKWFRILMLFVLPPYGIYIMHHQKRFGFLMRWVMTLLFVCYFLFVWLGFFGVNTGLNQARIDSWTAGIRQTMSDTVYHIKDRTSPTPTPTPTPTPEGQIPAGQ